MTLRKVTKILVIDLVYLFWYYTTYLQRSFLTIYNIKTVILSALKAKENNSDSFGKVKGTLSKKAGSSG